MDTTKGGVIAFNGPIVTGCLTSDEVRRQVRRHRLPHYVYALCDAHGSVFYVGKGMHLRLLQHAKEAARGGDSLKCRAIRQLGDDLRYAIIAVCEDAATALAVEAEWILLHRDELVNVAIVSGRQAATFRTLSAAFERMEMLHTLRRLMRMCDAMYDQATRSLELIYRQHPHMRPVGAMCSEVM